MIASFNLVGIKAGEPEGLVVGLGLRVSWLAEIELILVKLS
jgi:hypothetical protein